MHDSDSPPGAGLGQLDVSAVSQHEWFASLRRAGFTRTEALYIVTRPSVEMIRLEWLTAHPHAQ